MKSLIINTISRLFALVLLFSSLFYSSSLAQNSNVEFQKPLENFKIEPFLMMQFWGVHSSDFMADINGDGILDPVEDRANLHIRRGRLGFRANPYENLKFTLVSYFDGIGRDGLSASIGPANNPHGTEFGIWDAFFQYKISKNNDALHLTGGFFRPQLGRESITSGFATTSGEKAMQQNYIRRHLVGTGPGRAMGVNVGGQLVDPDNKWFVNYNAGYFNPQNTSSLTNTSGVNAAGLWVGRVVLGLGEPEQKTYRIGYQTNYYGKRKGLSVGLGGSYQGETDLFDESTSYGFDALLNWGKINFDTDWLWMQRSNGLSETDSYAGHIRASYNWVLPNAKILEPVIMWMRFEGPESVTAQTQAAALGSFSGTNDTYNIGLNYYLNGHRYKFILHYVIQEGSPGRNQLYSQSAIGVNVERSNYLLLGLNLIF